MGRTRLRLGTVRRVVDRRPVATAQGHQQIRCVGSPANRVEGGILFRRVRDRVCRARERGLRIAARCRDRLDRRAQRGRSRAPHYLQGLPVRPDGRARRWRITVHRIVDSGVRRIGADGHALIGRVAPALGRDGEHDSILDNVVGKGDCRGPEALGDRDRLYRHRSGFALGSLDRYSVRVRGGVGRRLGPIGRISDDGPRIASEGHVQVLVVGAARDVEDGGCRPFVVAAVGIGRVVPRVAPDVAGHECGAGAER